MYLCHHSVSNFNATFDSHARLLVIPKTNLYEISQYKYDMSQYKKDIFACIKLQKGVIKLKKVKEISCLGTDC